jgi:hypothetical protein
MVHPSDGDAWKALDNFDPEFASDARNVRIGLATDDFTPFNMTVVSYSCWHVIAITYNLPPALCMKYEFMFLCLVIPGPEHPGVRLNVMVQPLIEELKKLWQGVEAYDCFKKHKFNLHVAYLFSVHDFMAYGIFSGWSVHGRLICPYCAKDTDCFVLVLVARNVTLIAIDVFYPSITRSEGRERSLGRAPSSQRDHPRDVVG